MLEFDVFVVAKVLVFHPPGDVTSYDRGGGWGGNWLRLRFECRDRTSPWRHEAHQKSGGGGGERHSHFQVFAPERECWKGYHTFRRRILRGLSHPMLRSFKVMIPKWVGHNLDTSPGGTIGAYWWRLLWVVWTAWPDTLDCCLISIYYAGEHTERCS